MADLKSSGFSTQSGTIEAKIAIRRGNEADLPRLADGELAHCEDTHKLFIGDDEQGNIWLNDFSSVAKGDKGDSLEFVWLGTKLGVRVKGDGSSFEYVDLVGPRGKDLAITETVATNSELSGVRDLEKGNIVFVAEDNHGWFYNGSQLIDMGVIVGTQGPVGATGPQGPQGDTGATGPQGATGTFDVSTEYSQLHGTQKTIIGAINALYDKVETTYESVDDLPYPLTENQKFYAAKPAELGFEGWICEVGGEKETAELVYFGKLWSLDTVKSVSFLTE